MTTNAQAALQAAAVHYSSVDTAGEELILDAAARFKAWLDEQDEADSEARRKSNVEKLAGPRKGGATSRVRVVPEGEPLIGDGALIVGGIGRRATILDDSPPTMPGMIPPLAEPYPQVRPQMRDTFDSPF